MLKPLTKVLQDTALMQALALTEFAWLWISTKASPVCRVTVMQLNATGPGCKPQGANCCHVLESGKHVFRPRLSATPSGHVFQPGLPDTSSDVPLESSTLCFSAEQAVPLTSRRCATLSPPNVFLLAADGKDTECEEIQLLSCDNLPWTTVDWQCAGTAGRRTAHAASLSEQ